MTAPTLEMVATSAISIHKDNPRKSAGDVSDLATTIKANGIIEPLIVTPNGTGKTYVLLCGSRRLAAAKKAKVTTVPVVIHTGLDEKASLEMMLVENLHRENLSPIEEGTSLRRMIDDLGYTQRDLASRVGVSQAHISKRLALLELPEDLQKGLNAGSVSIGDAIELGKLKDTPEALTIAQERIANGGDAHRVVAQIQDVAKREAKIDAARADAEAKGFKVVEDFAYKTGIARLGKGTFDGLDTITAAKHKAEECHAIGIDFDGKQVPVCIKPTNHKEAVKDNPRAQKDTKLKEHEKQLRQGTKDRQELIEGYVAKRIPKTGLMDQITTALIQTANSWPTKLACRYLGLEVGKPDDYVDVRQVLLDFAFESNDNMARAGAALCAGLAEDAIKTGIWENALILDHFDALESLGYKQSKAEKLEIQGKGIR